MAINIFLLGAGGHAKVLLDCLLSNAEIKVLGILDNNPANFGKSVLSIPVMGSEDEILKNYSAHSIKLVNGIGSIGLTHVRESIFTKLKNRSYQFINVIHPMAYVGREVELGESVQIMAGSVIQAGCHIGNNVIVNTQASIDHDCDIQDHVHLAPGVICCGDVKIGKGTHVGTGAIILQGRKIADNCLIAAGAVVINDVSQGDKVAGVPAKLLE